MRKGALKVLLLVPVIWIMLTIVVYHIQLKNRKTP